MKLKLFNGVIVCLFLLLILIFWQGLHSNNEPQAMAEISKKNYLETIFNNAQIKTKKLPSGIKIINIWSSWCLSCQKEHGFLLKLAKQGYALIGINYRDDENKSRQWLKQHKNPYKLILQDPNGQLALEFGIAGVPETWLVGADGQLHYRYQGEIDQVAYATLLEKLQILQREIS